MRLVRPVSRLFTSAWIAEAIALGEHLCRRGIKISQAKRGDSHVAPFLWVIYSVFNLRQSSEPEVLDAM